MKGTRLWQEAGSPVIRGRSRRQRPFWQPWLGGALAADAVFAVVAVAPLIGSAFRGVGVGGSLSAWVPSGLGVALAALPGALIGSALGVWFARTAGWRNAWVSGGVVGVAFGAAGAWLLGGSLAFLGARLK